MRVVASARNRHTRGEDQSESLRTLAGVTGYYPARDLLSRVPENRQGLNRMSGRVGEKRQASVTCRYEIGLYANSITVAIQNEAVLAGVNR
jgi:hypothetical protein